MVIRAPRVVVPGKGEVARAIGVRDGRVAVVSDLDCSITAPDTWNLEPDVVLMPGLVDTHVHVNEPGNTEWEGFETATTSAAAGGITTLLDMPLNSIPVTIDVESLEIKRRAALGQCHVDVGFLGGLVPDNLKELVPLHEAGVFGFKCFLSDSGLKEFQQIDVGTMQEALTTLVKLDSPLLIHAENDLAVGKLPVVHSRRYADYLASRPRGYENLAIAQAIEAARRSGAHAHICHLSSSDALAMIESARRDGVFLTVESCPHYLSLTAEEIDDGATYFKCGPPIRETENREELWGGLRSNLIDMVVSDHSPSTPQLKTAGNGDFGAAWGGIASLQLTLPIIWTQARARGFSLANVAQWMSQGPARLVGLNTKGAIAIGRDADFCIFAPDESFVVDTGKLHHRNPGTPYDGRKLTGVVRSTVLRGKLTDPEQPHGRLLARGTA
jgi:allantoinase